MKALNQTIGRVAVVAALAFSIIPNVSGQTNGPVLGITKSGPDNPAVLLWSSQTNEIYRVDYTVGLTNWLTAIEDFSTQGTNTLWADLGSESGLEGRPSSADVKAPYRFYRIAVQSYMSNALPVTITVSNASEGTVLTELTNILAGAQSSSNLIAGRLLVDGNEVGIDSGTSYSFPLETRFYPNGTHRLSVNVEDNGDSGTTGGDDDVPDPDTDIGASYATKNISVVFSNSLSGVWLKYKGFRPELGQTQELHATLSPPRSWRVDITAADDTNTIYRTFTGNSAKILVQWDGLDSFGQDLSPQRIAYVITASPPFITYSTYKTFGTFGMMYQGHHPKLSPSNRPQRGAPFGQVTFATESGYQPPWGKIKAVKRIASDLALRFPISGYPLGFIYGDDDVSGDALRKSSLGGSNIFNNVTIGLFAGHSAAAKENIVALAHPQTYIPIYHTGAGSMDWVGMFDMDLGSSNLKWAAFYSCNLFRDSSYRANGCYSQMKNNSHLAINTDLHIMQGYATEMSVRHDMGLFWVVALIGPTSLTSDNTVLAAWRFVCLKTQPVEPASNANVSRSVYWEECVSDHIYGYGSQTDPDPDHIQPELLEDDQMANHT